MILPSVRDPRLITIRRGGLLGDADHQLLALWAAQCAEHVLDLFEAQQPSDTRPRDAIEAARAWSHGEMKMMEARARGGDAMGAVLPVSPRTPPAKQPAWGMSPSTISVPRPTRSRPFRQRIRATSTRDGLSVIGSASSSPTR